MSHNAALQEFLVLSRGQWDADRSKAEVQRAIDEFYVWYDGLVAEGSVRPGHRLAREGKTISKHRIADGPFAEAKELIGGYWTIVAGSLDEAAALAARNPCIACGLVFEVRPIELKRASAYEASNETPSVAV
ncbi:MAG TPA: YciI family protein [Burkholderiaceae bacterium]|nr:YciI family protein [Burkholderiaceae bacterium]